MEKVKEALLCSDTNDAEEGEVWRDGGNADDFIAGAAAHIIQGAEAELEVEVEVGHDMDTDGSVQSELWSVGGRRSEWAVDWN